MTITNPEKIGRYQIVERVGRGGMGVLYRGIDSVLDREVAIKVMLLDFSDNEEQLRTRFYREARAIAKLQHRNIVTVFEFADDGTTPYIVMEFLRGCSLAARIKSPLPLALEDKLNIVADLCEALNYAHEQEVVHRDVKPANVFLLDNGSVKLLDFGIAKVATSTLTRTSDLLGSVWYMSPEQVSGSSVDGRSDIFSAGVLLYELLSGRTPFDSEVPTATIVKILHEPPPSLDDVVPGLPPQLVAAVNRSLAKKPEDRYATADEFARALRAIRKALMAAGESQGLDETRFASLTEVRAILDAPAPAPTPGAREGAAAGGIVAASRTKAWPVAAGIGAVVLVGAILATVALGRGRPSTAAAPAPVAGLPAASPATAAAPASADGAAPKTAAVALASAGAVELRIESTPAGATITLDGQNTKQTTPASITLTGTEPHRLRLAKRGFVAQDITLADADLRRGAIAYALVPAAATTVPVSITSTYPVEVFSGSRSISGAAESHRLTVGVGATVHITSPQYLLDRSFKVEDRPIDFQAPALGYLTVLNEDETCKVKVGPKDLGYPPITKLPIAAGQHRVDIACANGTNPPGQLVTILPNNTVTARIY